MLIKMNKAQSTLEYALLIGVVVGALITIQSYVKRSLQGNLRETSNQIGDQYSPVLTEGTYTMNTQSSTTEDYMIDRYGTSTSGSQDTTLDQELDVLGEEWYPSHPAAE